MRQKANNGELRVALDMMLFGAIIAGLGFTGIAWGVGMMQGQQSLEPCKWLALSSLLVGGLLSPVARRLAAPRMGVTGRGACRIVSFRIMGGALLGAAWGALLLFPAELFAYAAFEPTSSYPGDPFASSANDVIGSFVPAAPYSAAMAACMGAWLAPLYASARSRCRDGWWWTSAALYVVVAMSSAWVGVCAPLFVAWVDAIS